VYERALAHEFGLRGLQFECQASLSVSYKGEQMDEYRADLLIDKKIILEIKALSGLVPEHEAQVLNYRAATKLRLALLLNFGTRSVQYKRIIR
jgi:GxxExxY protein